VTPFHTIVKDFYDSDHDLDHEWDMFDAFHALKITTPMTIVVLNNPHDALDFISSHKFFTAKAKPSFKTR
jgi:hypothetical protein